MPTPIATVFTVCPSCNKVDLEIVQPEGGMAEMLREVVT